MSGTFGVGDRVRVVRVDPEDDVQVGAIGTVLEGCTFAPWVRFDEPVPDSDFHNKLPGWRPGYMGCLNVDQLELLDKPTPVDCPEPHHAHHHDERGHKLHHWKERAMCMGLCTILHVTLEVISHVWVH